MFKVDVGEYSTPTLRLLKNIEDLLIEQNKLLKQSSLSLDKLDVDKTKNENRTNFDAMGRKELVEIIKTLPKGTIKGKWMTMSIEDLRNQVKGVT